MRTKLVVGNWKMYKDTASAIRLSNDIVKGMPDTKVGVVVCPPFPYLLSVGAAIQGSRVALGAQNASDEKEGAYTGEVSPAMLLDVGCRYVILGHSERRKGEGSEQDSFINRKVKLALTLGLKVILCVGESLAERNADQTGQVLRTQMGGSLAGVPHAEMPNLILAYEPVWAIGTGHSAKPEQAQHEHAFLRRLVGEVYGEATAQALLILYGGSVKGDNAASLFRCPDVDGGLIGGASLQAEPFLAIVNAAGNGGA
jgi:triosephosphate isomerase